MLRISGTSCTRATAQVSLALDGELSPFEQAELRTHLARCGKCHAYAEQAAAFTALVRQSEPEPFDMQILMPRRHRLMLRPLQIGAAAAMLAVVGLGGFLGLGGNGAILSSGVEVSSVQGQSGRPAYLDSASYELRLIRQVSGTDSPNGSAVAE
jgi:anti-sigma factor RsiW